MLDAPRTDPDEPDSSIRLLPRVCDGEAPLRRLPYAAQRLGHARPALGPERALLVRVPLWSSPLAPSPPPPGSRLCSTASQLLWRSQTSPGRTSAATAPHLPAADHSAQRADGRPRDLPVPVQGACGHARVFDHAGPSRRSRWRVWTCRLSATQTASAPGISFLSRLNCWPAHSPTDASPTSSRTSAHGSGPTWFATPSS